MEETSTFRKTWILYAMLLPGVGFAFVFNYLPMLGLVMAFQDYKTYLGFIDSPWVGWKHFEQIFSDPYAPQVIMNTVVISGLKIIFNLLIPLAFALLLNELRHRKLKSTVQTLVYLPHFLSWVILAGILLDLLSIHGIVNEILQSLFGLSPIMFLGDGNWFRFTVVLSDVWKEFGFSAIVFLAALTAVNPDLYEASEIDGANRWKMTKHVTIPAIMPIVIVVAALSLSSILNGSFDQIFNLYNPMVYEKGDIIDTFVYRTALESGQFSFATAVGLFKSAVGLVFITIFYRIAYVYADYRIF